MEKSMEIQYFLISEENLEQCNHNLNAANTRITTLEQQVADTETRRNGLLDKIKNAKSGFQKLDQLFKKRLAAKKAKDAH